MQAFTCALLFVFVCVMIHPIRSDIGSEDIGQKRMQDSKAEELRREIDERIRSKTHPHGFGDREHPRMKMESMRHEKHLEFIAKRHTDRLDKIDKSKTLSEAEKKELTTLSEEYLEVERRFSESRMKMMTEMHGPRDPQARTSMREEMEKRRESDRKVRDRMMELKELFDLRLAHSSTEL